MTPQNETVRENVAPLYQDPQEKSAGLRPVFWWADVFNAPLHDFPLRDEILFQYAAWGRARDILEVGPGSGNTAFRLRRHAATLTLLDTTPEILEILKEEFDAFGNVRFLCMNLSRTNLEECPEMAFDFIYGLDVFEYISNPAACLQTLARALRAGGCLFLTFPNKPPPEGDSVTWFTDSAKLENLLQDAGFQQWDIFCVRLKPFPAVLYEILHEMPLRLYRKTRRRKGGSLPQTYEETWAFQNRKRFLRYKPIFHLFWVMLEKLMRMGGDTFAAQSRVDSILGNQLVVRAWR